MEKMEKYVVALKEIFFFTNLILSSIFYTLSKPQNKKILIVRKYFL